MATELLVLGGERTEAAEGATFSVTEPGTGGTMAEVAEAGPEDARRAVDVAVRAFEEGPWPRTSATERGRILLRASTLVRERLEDIARVEARNAGKPIGDARDELGIVAGTLEYWGGAANKIFGETVPIQDQGLDVTLREPVGVCALITPWNFPLVIATWKIAPALACGNTIIVKPATYTPLSVLMLADVLLEAGLPPETMSVLPGPGSAVGNALVSDPRVNKVGFTGSTEVGSKIMAMAAQNITRVSLELGGQVGERGVRGRGHGPGRRARRVGGVREHRTGLLRAEPGVRRTARVRRVRVADGRADRRAPRGAAPRRGRRSSGR